jgi:hypothetical protein
MRDAAAPAIKVSIFMMFHPFSIAFTSVIGTIHAIKNHWIDLRRPAIVVLVLEFVLFMVAPVNILRHAVKYGAEPKRQIREKSMALLDERS